MSMKTSDPLPDSNSEGMDLMAEHLSAERARGFRAAGLTFVQGYREGVRIGDLDGNEFINCRCSGGVFNFGHRPAFAIDALKHALDEFGDMGDWLLPSAVRARGAGALAGILPGDLRYSFFTPGGAEAVEVACKLARGATGRTEFVAPSTGITATSDSPWPWMKLATTTGLPRWFPVSSKFPSGTPVLWTAL